MNLKKLLSFVLVFLLLGIATQAQTTFYVNSQIGSDGRNGLTATIPSPDDGITGPKLTVTNAMTAAVDGDKISVANTGINYPEAGVTVTKKLTFTSTNGTPRFTNAAGLVINQAAAANKVIFEGPFRFDGGLTLTTGVVEGGTNLTIGTQVTRTNNSSVTGQLNYTGTLTFTYNLTANLTTGDEFPVTASTGVATNLTTTGAFELKLEETKTISGILNTAGKLNLNSGVLNISGANAHAVAGDVTNGTLAFALTGAASIAGTGTEDLPNITVTKSTAILAALTVAVSIVDVDNVTASGNGSVTLLNTGDVDDLTNNGAGTILASNVAGTCNNVLNTSTGTITLGVGAAAHTVTGNVTQSGLGVINYVAVTSATVTGNVLLNSTVTLVGTAAAGENVANQALITFPNATTAITGTVTNNFVLAGTQNDGANTNLGVISFTAAAAAVNAGNVVNDAKSTATITAPATIAGNGLISFVTGGVLTLGDVSVTGSWANGVAAINGNGSITSTGGGALTAGAISNTSSTVNGFTNCDINLAGAGTFTVSSITSSGAAGGDIYLPSGNGTVTNSITNLRTAAGADITVGGGASTLGVAGSVTNSGSANITALNTGNTTITGNMVQSGSGTTSFAVTTGSFTTNSTSVSLGTLSLAAQTSGGFSPGTLTISGGTLTRTGTTGDATASTFTLSGGIANITGDAVNTDFFVTGAASMTKGTLNLLGMIQIRFSGSSITIGNATDNPSFTGEALVAMNFDEPIPNVLQTITIGSQIPEWDGTFNVINPANLAEVTRITGGNFRVNNNVTINNAGGVFNATTLDGAKIWIGKNNPAGTTGNFANTTGYKTVNDGRIVMQGNAAQQVTFGGSASFGAFEVDNNSGAAEAVFFTTTATNEADAKFTDFFYLAEGGVEGQDVNFDNSSSFPTIVRNEGSFVQAPTFTSMVNVSYIGGVNHTTANEIPAAANKLYNMTVATSNSPTMAGRATVTVAVNTTVNGTLTVYNKQGVNIANAVTLTLAGAQAKLFNANNDAGDGGIIGNTGTGALVLGALTGTTITGSTNGKSWLPSLQIANNSVGNVITGIDGLVDDYYGGDGVFSGNESTVTDGNLTFVAGAPGTGSLTAIFNQNLTGGGALIADLTNITVNSTLNLGANLYASGNLVMNSGTVNVNNYTLFVDGTANQIDGNATVTGAGKLRWQAGANVTLAIPSKDATLTVGTYEIALGNAANRFEITTNDLILAGNVTVTQGEMWLGTNVPVAQDITVTGSALTLTTNSSVKGNGILTLNPATPPLTFTFTGTPSITNLTQLGDVVMAGNGTGLTISGTYLHNGGELNFDSRTVTTSGVFTHAAGTYAASSGYLVFSGATFNNNASFDIPNFRYTAGSVAFSNTGHMTVTAKLDVNVAAGGTWTVDKDPLVPVVSGLTVNDGVVVTWTKGTITPQPVYVNAIDLTITSDGTTGTLPANIWPTALTVNKLVVNSGANNTNLATGTYTVATSYTNTSGTLTLPNYVAPVTDPIVNVTGTTTTIVAGGPVLNGTSALNLADGSQLNLNGGSVTGTGTFKYGVGQNVQVIAGTVAGTVNRTDNSDANMKYAVNGVPYAAGNELPGTVNNLSLTRTVNSANAAVTIAANTTVNGTLDIKNDLTVAPAAVTLSVAGNVTVASEASNFAAATNPTLTFTGALAFIGAQNQIVTLLGNQTFGNITINKAASTNTVELVGGNMVMNPTTYVAGPPVVITPGAVVTFTNGILKTNNNSLVLDTPFLGGGQGFINNAVAPNYSHVLGNVSRTTINTGNAASSSVPTIIFPVGSASKYRPVIITFNNTQSGTPTMPNTTFMISHTDMSPTGVVGLPIADGVEPGVAVSRYPGFFWGIATTPISVSPSIAFDIELQAAGYTDYDDINKVRLIRRQGSTGDTQNQWLQQGGTNLFYDNAVISSVPAVIVRNAQAGLVAGGATFTYGMRSRLTIDNPVANQNLELGGAAFTVDLNNPAVFGGNQGALVYSASSTNASVATAAVANGVLTVTPVAAGSATIQVTATDVNNDFTTTSFNVNVNPPTNFPVTGTVTYNNTAADPFVGATVQLWQNNAVAYTATTVAGGAFNFPAVTNGTYTMTATYAGAWPNQTAADAFAVAAHYVGTTPITNAVTLKAADVNADNKVFNSDALLIVRRFAGLANSFAAGDWYFEMKSVTVNGAAAMADLKGIAVGDANANSAPTALAKSAEAFTDGKVVKVSPKKEFELPILASESMELGALSLGFTYPTDLVELVGVKAAKDGVLYSDVDGKVKVAWADMTGGKSGMKVAQDASVLILTFKPTENFKSGSKFAVEVDGVNELVTVDGNVLSKSGLKAGTIEASIPDVFALAQNYPNPFNPSTVIEYALPENAKVTLSIYNILGQEVSRLIDAEQEAGVYKFNWNASSLASGVYIYRINVEAKSKNFTDTKRMMLLK